jgi:hypothetical protein
VQCQRLGSELSFPRTSTCTGGGVAILSLRAKCGNPIAPTKIASALLCLAMTERGRAFSGGEDGHSRLVGAGFSGSGYMGNYISHVRFGKLEIALSGS